MSDRYIDQNQNSKPKIKAKIRSVPELWPEIDDDLLAFPLYDLRDSSGQGQGSCRNGAIIGMLDDLINHTIKVKAGSVGKDKSDHQRRINSFIRGRDGIKDYVKEIRSGAQAQKDIEGVGKGIATRIDEFLKTGSLEELKGAISPEAKLIMELTEITGIGEVKAKSLITEHGVLSVDDLISKYKNREIRVAKNQLTHHIAVGLDYYHDLKQRMSWAEADQIASAITKTISGNGELIVHVCGSYRRHKPTCGDIDVLISHSVSGPSPLPDIVTKLESVGILIGHLTTKGKTKYMGVCKGPSGTGRRIDIRFVEYDSLGAAMLYFTGSGKFNKIMRYHANTRGFTLNEYGLYTYVNGVKGEIPIPAPTEQDIFKKLGFIYLQPTEREF
jgi:DNA polymerase/3'-5' exonuclease PolX